jgi:hypothetical protein
MGLQQGFANGEMGFRVRLHGSNPFAADVRFGSKADIEARPSDVRFTPKSGHPDLADGLPGTARAALPGTKFTARASTQ